MTSTVEKKHQPTEDELVDTSKESAVGEAPGGGVVGVADSINVNLSTVSTPELGKRNLEKNTLFDGYVTSGIANHASLTGRPMNPPSSDAAAPNISRLPNTAAPTQVILSGSYIAEETEPVEACDPSELSTPAIIAAVPETPPPAASSEPTVLVAEVIQDSQSANSTLPVSDPPPSMTAEPERSHPRSTSGDALLRSPALQQSSLYSNQSDEVLDNYIRSPEAQNVIVERSPGGRYVRFTEKLGSGASKDVYRAYDTQEGIEVAWNVVPLSGVPKNERNRIVNEVRLLERLHHQNIISFHGSWVNRERQEVNFVTEILSSGTLKSFIAKVQVIRWKIAKRWARQILLGLEYLHSQDPPVIHRDLKCENVFINGTSGDLRIGDLGLSTVHHNGRVLSVLGTPEFMAPDMYEERSYDEKVDIYAFGMCMLEIFTKEIPYAECNNPAQIYKKVSSGEPPEVLSRLKSRHAREFVELCMGYRNETGIYVRPSATELLKHPFLVERSDDGGEVVVERPLRERAIMEDRESNGSSLMQYRANPSNSRARVTSYDNEGDQFDEMPESETNMKKVKVLMGRDQVLDEETNFPAAQVVQTAPEEAPAPKKPEHAETHFEVSQVQEPGHPPQQQQAEQQLEPVRNQTETSKRHYLVAAAVIEDKGPNIRPYADEILQLVVTLPVEGQTQNVQFGFHLVEDDAVKVAREMVQELDIPQDAVLEVSETISALACEARKKQEKYTTRMGQQQTTGQQVRRKTNDRQGTVPDHQVPVPPSYVATQDQALQQGQPPSHYAPGTYAGGVAEIPQNITHPQVGHFSSMTRQQPSDVHHGQGQASPPAQHPQAQQVHHTQAHATPSLPQHHLPQGQLGPTPLYHGAPAQTLVSLHPPAQQTSSIQVQVVAPESIMQQHQGVPVQQHLAPSDPQSGNATAPRYITSEQHQFQQGQAQAPVQRDVHANFHGVLLQGQSPSHPPVQVQGGPEAQPVQATNAPSQPYTDNISSSTQTSTQPYFESALGLPPGAPLTVESVMQAHAEAVSRVMVEEGLSQSLHHHLYADEDQLNEEVKEKLRKLEEDYQKNLKIAKKVFEGRMENLARSQTEKEAQHQKTLEKHEKERLAFEKRRALEEEQQMKRIEQLQKEWDKKREMLAQQMALAAAGSQADSQQQTNETCMAPSNGSSSLCPPQGAQRNLSTSSNQALTSSDEGTDQSQHVQ